MTYTPSKTTKGFEFLYNKNGFSANPVPYMLLPNTAFLKGQAVSINPATGCIRPQEAAHTTGVVGIMAESILAVDNPAAGETYGMVYDNPDNVYKVSFTNYREVDAIAGSTTTFEAAAIDDGVVGALIFVYAGPSAGSIRRISAVAANIATVVLPFPAAITNASQAVILGANGAGGAINVGVTGVIPRDTPHGMRVDAQATPAAAGFLTVMAVDMVNCMMDVMIQKSRHITG